MGQVVDKVKIKGGMNLESMTVKGYAEGKFVAGGAARFFKTSWKPSTTGSNTESRVLQFIDVSISAWDGEQQGEFILPTISARVMQTRGAAFGTRIFVSYPFDNERQNVRFRSLSLSEDMMSAFKGAVKFAIEEATEGYNEQGGGSVMSNTDFIGNADKLLEVASKIKEFVKKDNAAAGASGSGTAENAKKVDNILSKKNESSESQA